MPEGINRREALRRAALLLGGAISAPAIAGVLAGCDVSEAFAAEWSPLVLTPAQAEMVAAIAERIIPETDTPGARSAQVHRFIDRMLSDYYSASERNDFLTGLADVDARAHQLCGRPFASCSTGDQHALVERLDRETFAPTPAVPSPNAEASRQTERGGGGLPTAANTDTTGRAPSRPTAPRESKLRFFRTMKELTILGYYTSKEGATRELRHVQVPGRFEACVPLRKIGRAWAV